MILERCHLSRVKMNRRINLLDLNAHLMCVLCGGYFIDATTIIECLHSFCRSCIVKHLESSKYCPICEVMVHKTKPLINIRRDKTLQNIVYKMVPGLYTREMKNRRQFYEERPHYVKPDDSESGGDVSDDALLNTCEESYTVALRYHETLSEEPRYLNCPVGVSIKHLQKLILCKFGLNNAENVAEIFLKEQPLPGDLTLMDIASLYIWRTKEPLELSYMIYEKGIKKPPLKEWNTTEITVSDEVSSPVVTHDPVENEVQLQITEAGLMKCEVDSRLVYSELDSNKSYLVPPPQCLVLDSSIAPAIFSTNSYHHLGIDSSAPKPVNKVLNNTVNQCEMTGLVEAKLPRPKRHSTEHETGAIAAKRLSIEGKEKVDAEKDSASVSSSVTLPEEKIIEKDQRKDISKVDESCAVMESAPLNEEKKLEVENVEIIMDANGKDEEVKKIAPEVEGPKEEFAPEVKAVPGIQIQRLKPNPPPGVISTHESRRIPEVHKPIRTAPKMWNPVIAREKLRPTLMKSSDDPHKPSKIFKMRSMPRYLGNPASGVKPMYSNGLPPAAPPITTTPPRARVDPKPPTRPPTPKLHEEKKPPNSLLTSPFIPRDNHFLLPDPKTSHPLSPSKVAHPLSPSKIPFPPAFHTSLPPCITSYLTQQPVRNVKLKDAPGKICDSTKPDTKPSASSSSKERESTAVFVGPSSEQHHTKCSS